MDVANSLLAGFATVLTPMNLAWSLIGVTLGTAIGVLPGIGPALTIALLLPVTFNLDPTSAFIIFGGVYYGAAYGCSTTSILVNTPGETASLITAIDGYKMAKKGRAGAALATAAIGSFVAGTIGTVLLAISAPLFTRIALLFGPAEYFALAVLGFISVSSILGGTLLLGMISLFTGLALGVVGIDPQSSTPRYTFGIPDLLDGIGVTTACVGIFAIGEILWVAFQHRNTTAHFYPVKGSLWMSKDDWQRSWKPWVRGSFLGFPFGVLPAGGAEIPTFLSYSLERKLAKNPKEFGEGAIEGVAGPESTNNSAAAGVLVPLLTLGLPTSATAAIMLAAFQQYGIQPGPLLFATNSAMVWSIIASLFLGNFMLLVLNLPMIGIWVKLLKIPHALLYAGVLLFSMVGVFAASNSVAELLIAVCLGILGFGLRYFGLPIAPVVVGLVLGPIAEVQLRRALQISQGDWLYLASHPISASLYVAAVLFLVLPPLLKLLKKH